MAPDGIEHADWSWPDERLLSLRHLGVTPIVGLVHHGSGPRHTSLVDPAFAEQLAAYAGMVARALSMDSALHAGQRAAHYRTLFRACTASGIRMAATKEPLSRPC